jgi:hypothetical protein
VRVEERLVGVERTDDVLEPLVRDDSADEQDIDPVVLELTGGAMVGNLQVIEAGHHGQHAGRREPQCVEFLAVVLGVAEGEVAA